MKATDTIENSEDLIDSRDVIERIAFLQREVESGDNDCSEELESLLDLEKEAEGYAPDWRHGATLIRRSYFVKYCQEMLEDCGDIPKDLPHYIRIDWQATADEIGMDYTDVDFDGVTYLVR